MQAESEEGQGEWITLLETLTAENVVGGTREEVGEMALGAVVFTVIGG